MSGVRDHSCSSLQGALIRPTPGLSHSCAEYGLGGSQLAALLCFLVAAGGCGDNEAPVGPDAGPCWPEILPDESSQGARVNLGYVTSGPGGNSTVPLESGSLLALEAGPQGGFHLRFDVQVSGIITGDPTNIRDSQNPRTRLSAYSTEGTDLDGITCPTRLAYAPAPSGDLILPRPYTLVIDEYQLDAVYGHNIVVAAEVLDADGTYVREEYSVSIARRDTTRGPQPCASCHVLQRNKVPDLDFNK